MLAFHPLQSCSYFSSQAPTTAISANRGGRSGGKSGSSSSSSSSGGCSSGGDTAQEFIGFPASDEIQTSTLPTVSATETQLLPVMSENSPRLLFMASESDLDADELQLSRAMLK